MKYLTSQNATVKFKWQLSVYITSLLEIGVNPKDIVVLFSDSDSHIPKYIRDHYHVDVHVYEDNREDKSYIPSIKPYLVYRYLDENPFARLEDYVYTDSDIIIREPLDFSLLPADCKNWYGSDCGGYLDMEYLNYVDNSEKIINAMLETVGVTIDDVKSIDANCIGAQYIISNPSPEYFKKVYQDSYKLYHATIKIESNFQHWVAEMYATLWNMPLFNINPHISDELAFTWGTDSAETFKENKIYHDAGVVDGNQGLFYKGNYNMREPFDDDFSFISKDKASYYYTQYIKATK